jgi:ATP-dependent exoDNAse (exonuclease V) beta subunit
LSVLSSRRPYSSGNTTCRFKWLIWQHNSSPATGSYGDNFRDADQVFYGHVLGFKRLERRAVVLVVNEASAFERSRERLYVGLSRARDQLVVCGDPDFIREVGGPDLARRLNLAAAGFGAL